MMRRTTERAKHILKYLKVEVTVVVEMTGGDIASEVEKCRALPSIILLHTGVGQRKRHKSAMNYSRG